MPNPLLFIKYCQHRCRAFPALPIYPVCKGCNELIQLLPGHAQVARNPEVGNQLIVDIAYCCQGGNISTD